MTSPGVEVTPERLLAARAVFLKHAERISVHLKTARRTDRRMIGLCGWDPISQDAQEAFDLKINEYAIKPAQQFAEQLQQMAKQLEATARAYETAELQALGSLRDVR